MAGLGVGLVALFVVTTVGTVLTGRAPSVGFSLAQSLYFSLTLVAGAAVFLAVGALTSQLATTRRRAASMAAVIFGVAYALRMVADSDPGLHWMVWLSPLGWIEEARPLIDPHPMALLPVRVLGGGRQRRRRASGRHPGPRRRHSRRSRHRTPTWLSRQRRGLAIRSCGQWPSVGCSR